MTAGGADYLHAYISLTWEDVPKTGDLVVSKAVNYGSWSGFTFRLHGTSDKGNSVDVTATTGSDGKAYFKDIEIGTYTLEEVSPGNAYILPEPQAVTIPGDDIAYATVENVWKHWRATITKVDADTGCRYRQSCTAGRRHAERSGIHAIQVRQGSCHVYRFQRRLHHGFVPMHD